MQPQTLPPTSGFRPPTYGGPRPEDNVIEDYAGPRQDHIQEHTFDFPIKGKLGGSKDQPALKVKPKAILTFLGTLVMVLLVVIPCWNCIGLLNDEVFMYMVGNQVTGWLLTCCCLMTVLCYITLALFFKRSEPEVRTEQSLLMISCVFLSALGIILILFAQPLYNQAVQAHRDFQGDCKLNVKTQKLQVSAEELESLRIQPYCTKLSSIEDCEGYDSYKSKNEAMIIKYMENNYQCSGFCAGTNSTGAQIYPPTLFSKADYMVSCDGMAARHIRNFDEQVLYQMEMEGCVLVAVAVFISFGQLLGFCGRRSEEAKSSKSYGATL